MKRLRYAFSVLWFLVQKALPSLNELLLLAGVALVTRGLFDVWEPLIWLWPGMWLILWGLGRMLPPRPQRGDE